MRASLDVPLLPLRAWPRRWQCSDAYEQTPNALCEPPSAPAPAPLCMHTCPCSVQSSMRPSIQIRIGGLEVMAACSDCRMRLTASPHARTHTCTDAGSTTLRACALTEHDAVHMHAGTCRRPPRAARVGKVQRQDQVARHLSGVPPRQVRGAPYLCLPLPPPGAHAPSPLGGSATLLEAKHASGKVSG